MQLNKTLTILLLSCFLSIFMLTESKSQVITGNVVLQYQSDVDAFDDVPVPITTITGNLTIQLFDDYSDINDLTPLSTLTSVGGSLLISNCNSLTSLSGLDALKSVSGIIYIGNNIALQSLSGLDALNSVGSLFLGGNSTLQNLSGLDALTSVGGPLRILSNSALTSLSGLDAITSVDGELLIKGNTTLTEFCSLFSLLNGNGLNGAYAVTSNALNPTIADILAAGACCSDIILTTQAEVNSFGATNPTSVCGNLIIKKGTSDDITDLSPLSTLTSIGGDLSIGFNQALTSLVGLDGLTSVGANIDIELNQALISLSGLDALTSVGGSLNISYNPALSNFTGLDALTFVGGYLRIAGVPNSALTSLAGLDALTSVGGFLLITGNTAITNLSGLDALTSVGEDLRIENNSELTSLSGLGALTSVGEDLVIRGNAALTSLTGLDALTSLRKDIEISGNTALTEFCSLFPLVNRPFGDGDYDVFDNAVNPTRQQIIDGGACVLATPAEMITELITSVDGSGIHKGTKRLLTGFLNSADKSLDRGREKLAILKLVAFKWLVKVQSPRKIDAALAGEWIGKAEEIIDAIKTDAGLNKSAEFEELASEEILPETYNLNQNYPNPFNPTTTISYSIPSDGNVSLIIYDALGSEVAVLDNGFRTAGNYSHTFDASNLSSGMYFYTIRSGNFVQTKKMLLMK